MQRVPGILVTKPESPQLRHNEQLANSAKNANFIVFALMALSMGTSLKWIAMFVVTKGWFPLASKWRYVTLHYITYVIILAEWLVHAELLVLGTQVYRKYPGETNRNDLSHGQNWP